MGFRAALVVMLASSIARADVYFAEIAGGVSVPVADDAWTFPFSPSPKVSLGVGTMRGELGGMVSLDWTHELSKAGDGGLGFPEGTASLDRFRLLVNAVARHRVSPSITLSARAAAGVDIAIGKVDDLQDFGGGSVAGHDIAPGAEVGVGVWFDIGPGVQCGLEVALPVSFHRDAPFYQVMYLTFDYTSVDVDVLFAVRF